MTDWQSSSTPLLRKLENVFSLSDDERRAIQDLPARLADIAADKDIVREGDRPSRSFFVLKGLTCTYKLAGEGRRQIVSFHIPGDAPDLQSLYLEIMDTSIATMTPCKLGFVPHEALRDLCARFPSLLWRGTGWIQFGVVKDTIADRSGIVRDGVAVIAAFAC